MASTLVSFPAAGAPPAAALRWLACAGARADPAVLWLTARLRLPAAAAGQRWDPWGLVRDGAVAADRLVVVGPQALGTGGQPSDGERARYGQLLALGARVVPAPTVLGRDGVPAVRRLLETLPAGSLALVVDADVLAAGSRDAATGALVGIARAVAGLGRRGRLPLAAVDLRGFVGPARGEALGAARARLLAALFPRSDTP